MSYVLRVWVHDRQTDRYVESEQTLESDTAQPLLDRMREIIAVWPNVWGHLKWTAIITAEPPRPERSWEIAKFPHTPTRTPDGHPR